MRHLRTPRLSLDALNATRDRGTYVRLWNSPVVVRWTSPPRAPDSPHGDGGAWNTARVDAWLHEGERQWADLGHGTWTIRLAGERNDAGEPIGRVALVPQQVELDGYESTRHIEVGWALLPAWHGHRYATEAARAVLAAAWAHLPSLEEVVSMTLLDNGPSRRVMERLGMQPTDEFDRVGLRHVLYRLPRPVPPAPRKD